ncbi:U-scoloptoxin(01)-Cw1a-like [Tribolium madens]|uniref:U-scoloptoxin(01)-Cw1a-like n=1 Tax=Tribolium madens TaxID=41895 RepID=UPI001CF746FB|nr:U-scoloptoxin(01)-Cw1a-like [Tribolium madens]
MKFLNVVPILFCVVNCAPKLRIIPSQTPPQLLTLPSNATSIRLDISDSFSCDNRAYGYYADVENDCQIFHVCLPITYSDGHNQTFRWSFICPEDTVFNQEIFTCTRSDEAMDCADSPRYYDLNTNLGNEELEDSLEDVTAVPQEVPQVLSRRGPYKN